MKLGIILANTGSPSAPDPDSVEEYLTAFLTDPQICQLPRPLWKKLMQAVLPKRKYSSSERYKFIWTEEGAPLVVDHRKLAALVQQDIDAADSDDTARLARFADEGTVVRTAMSYGEPSFEGVIDELREDGCTRIVLLPTYPQSAFCVTTAVVNRFKQAVDRSGWDVPYSVIDNYHDNPLYIKAIAESIAEAGYDHAAGDRLVLSLHAIPLKDEKNGDTYRSQANASAALIASRLGVPREDVTLSYQSVFGPKKDAWASPLTLDVLEGWHDGSFRAVVCCMGFSTACLETLYDVPCEFVPALEGPQAKPVKDHFDGTVMNTVNSNGRFVWVPSLGPTQRQARMLANVLRRHIDSIG